MAKTMLYMDEHGLSYDQMAERKAELSAKEKELTAKIAEAQNRLTEVNVLKNHIINYSKTKDVYVGYRKSGYSLSQCQVMNWCQIIYLEAIRAIQYNK